MFKRFVLDFVVPWLLIIGAFYAMSWIAIWVLCGGSCDFRFI